MATPEYTKDPQGVEFQLSANHLGHFLLTNLLIPSLKAAGDARVVNISSQGYRASHFHFDDWNFSDGKTYGMSSGCGRLCSWECLMPNLDLMVPANNERC